MPDPLLEILARYWGYHAFRPLQQEAMQAILDGQDSVVVLPTGGGKSLCFQAPALARSGLAVVVSPLISLMKDQVDTLRESGVPAACYHSALPADERASVASGIREGRYRLLYVSPERLAGEGSEAFAERLQDVRFVAVDEAHCISQWGHDFRPEYRQLARLRERWPAASLHAFTATATARVRRDIAGQLALRNPIELIGSFDRPNLVYRVLPRANLKRQLLDVLARHRGEAGIVYCISRREVDALAAWLVDQGVRAHPYHAGLADDERHRNQEAFIQEHVDVMVATVAFGMGIDRSNLRFVVHAGAPQSLEHYQQESGRAGRDGLDADCVLLFSGADFLKWRTMLERSGEFTEGKRTLLREMERYASSVGCRHRHLVAYFGQRYPDEPCDACDVCLGELERIAEPVVVSRKILSCIARLGQRFGAAHVVNVLRGSDSEQVSARGHHRLSTFGLLRDVPIAELRGYLEQLAGHGLIAQSAEPFPVLMLTSDGVRLMKNPESRPALALVRQRRPTKERPARGSRAEAESWDGVDRVLFDRLRALRLDLARVRGVPPYVIFHDTTLRDMARLKPITPEALRQVYGVGTRKAESLGEQFLEVIRQHAAGAEPGRVLS